MRSNVPIALSRRSAYKVRGVTELAIDIVPEVDAFVRQDCGRTVRSAMYSCCTDSDEDTSVEPRVACRDSPVTVPSDKYPPTRAANLAIFGRRRPTLAALSRTDWLTNNPRSAEDDQGTRQLQANAQEKR